MGAKQHAFTSPSSFCERMPCSCSEDPTGVETTVWLARRLGYLDCYQDALRVLTVGLAHHPDSPELLRHRGHRYITVRRSDLAVKDLGRAAALCKTVRISHRHTTVCSMAIHYCFVALVWFRYLMQLSLTVPQIQVAFQLRLYTQTCGITSGWLTTCSVTMTRPSALTELV